MKKRNLLSEFDTTIEPLPSLYHQPSCCVSVSDLPLVTQWFTLYPWCFTKQSQGECLYHHHQNNNIITTIIVVITIVIIIIIISSSVVVVGIIISIIIIAIVVNVVIITCLYVLISSHALDLLKHIFKYCNFPSKWGRIFYIFFTYSKSEFVFLDTLKLI